MGLGLGEGEGEIRAGLGDSGEGEDTTEDEVEVEGVEGAESFSELVFLIARTKECRLCSEVSVG